MSGNSFSVTGLNGSANVLIFDLSGKGVAKFSSVSNNEVLSTSNLKAGIYGIKVINGVNTYNTKLVLN